MSRSLTEVTLHFVWTTKKREPVLTPEWEPMIYRCIQNECRRSNTSILALGGMPDHVHLLVAISGLLSAAQIMQQVKGVSARFANGQLPLGMFLKWQEGYSVFSVGRSNVPQVKQYILCQKQHHAEGSLQEDWEYPTDD